MGVPALFRWLQKNYPKIISKCKEELPNSVDGIEIPIDLSQPNPNGEEFDNLYLDMNGIVHPCTHPEDKPPPKNEDEAMIEIFRYIDRIMAIIRPRKLLYMAIDGTAPRAKMNQQRSRRFRTAQEAKAQAESAKKARQDLIDSGVLAEDKGEEGSGEQEEERFDSNCITPGTPFMKKLSDSLQYYIAQRLEEGTWGECKVILSDASVPGEGEHKIMEYLRGQRAHQMHNPNLKHVIYGLDADLIMLALLTHEPHFKVLREDVFFQNDKDQKCYRCNQFGHRSDQCTGQLNLNQGKGSTNNDVQVLKPFIFLNVNVLREYLEVEMFVPNLQNFKFYVERAIDDWIFLCFFVGNDFLPHMPSLEIREDAISRLIRLYKDNLQKMGGYLVHKGDVDLQRLQILMEAVGQEEPKIFQDRKKREDEHLARQKAREDRYNDRKQDRKQSTISQQDRRAERKANRIMEQRSLEVIPINRPDKVKEMNQKFVKETLEQKNKSNFSHAEMIKQKLLGKRSRIDIDDESKESVEEADGGDQNDSLPSIKVIVVNADGIESKDEVAIANGDDLTSNSQQEFQDSDVIQTGQKEVKENGNQEQEEIEEVDDDDEEEDDINADNVRLWEDGYRDRYYERKFGVDATDIDFRKKLVHSYVEGLCWVLKYYFQGCQSWKWYFPYHYAPFAQDFELTDLQAECKIEFDKGTPFKPFEQLMGVLPAGSKSHIPHQFHHLMTKEDSTIIDFYPEDFKIDLNGKKYAWQGVALLPFIDENRLKDAMEQSYALLDQQELQLDQFGQDILYICKRSIRLYNLLKVCYDDSSSKKLKKPMTLNAGIALLSGSVQPFDQALREGSAVKSAFKQFGMGDLKVHSTISLLYYNTKPKDGYCFPAEIPRNAKVPARVLSEDDRQFVLGGRQRRSTQSRHASQSSQASSSSFNRQSSSQNFDGQSQQQVYPQSAYNFAQHQVSYQSGYPSQSGSYQQYYGNQQQQQQSQYGSSYQQYQYGYAQQNYGYGQQQQQYYGYNQQQQYNYPQQGAQSQHIWYDAQGRPVSGGQNQQHQQYQQHQNSKQNQGNQSYKH
ncbi:hypothetical protein MP228_008520 [Amoeboaphelidium protococcarum]|nr:hypothetical protein MP228_008520 [Amoeboaphelidium protococcarum]